MSAKRETQQTEEMEILEYEKIFLLVTFVWLSDDMDAVVAKTLLGQQPLADCGLFLLYMGNCSWWLPKSQT